MELTEERAHADPEELGILKGASPERATHKRTVKALPAPADCWREAQSVMIGLCKVLAYLAVTIFIVGVFVGLAVYYGVLKQCQSSEQFQTKGPQSDAAANGKDGDVLPPCGDDWIWYRNKCYYFSDYAGNWTEAKDSCAALNSSLALIDTRKELDFMLRHKGDRDHWIGLQREMNQNWTWVDGTEFSNWFVVEDVGECAYLSHGKVKSAERYDKCKWICTKVSAYERKRKKRSLILQHFH